MAEQRTNPFVIDLANLHEEWRSQPQYARQAGIRKAEAKRTVMAAKVKLKVVEARKMLAIRDDPESYDLPGKPTKDILEAAVIVSTEYMAALTELNQAEYELDIAEADVIAFIDRRKALENEVELLALDFYNEREPKPLSEAGKRTLESRQRRRTLGDGIDPDDLK
jgi:hypothetical protein